MDRRKVVVFLGVAWVCLAALVGCRPAAPETPSPATAVDVPTARVTAVPTETSLPTTTPSPSPVRPTKEPAAEPTAALEPTPTFTPTPSPWLINRSAPFFFFAPGGEILAGYPDGQFQSITQGRLLMDQPWSPDGTRFLFWTGSWGGWSDEIDAFMADLQTGDVQPVDFLNLPNLVYWSPNGRYIAYPEVYGDNNRLMLHDFETGDSIILVTILRENQDARGYFTGWSPDSRKVSYVAEVNGQDDLFVIDVEDLTIQQLTNDSDIEFSVVWSPAENELLFATKSEAFGTSGNIVQELYLIDGSSDRRQLLGEFENVGGVAWSPNGQQIVVINADRLCILTLSDLSRTCPLDTVFPANEYSLGNFFYPAWSPDGRWIAFQATKRHEVQCLKSFVLDILTNEVVNLEVNGCGATPFYWLPAVP